jgi:hypothetical protein
MLLETLDDPAARGGVRHPETAEVPEADNVRASSPAELVSRTLANVTYAALTAEPHITRGGRPAQGKVTAWQWV